MMNQRHFDDLTFNLALARARAADANFIIQVLAENGPKPSRDIGEVLKKLSAERMARHWANNFFNN